jgi:hypothetical protein
MNDHTCFETKYPSRSIFGKVLSLGWYDGTTSGLAQCSHCSTTFKYDIVDWDSDQEQRMFSFSPISPQDFERTIKVLSSIETPNWPFWFPKWQFAPQEKKSIKAEVDECLARAGRPEYLVASDRRLEVIFAVKRLSGPERDRLPAQFDGLPTSNDFAYWKDLVGLPD